MKKEYIFFKIDKFLTTKTCKKIIKEIDNFNNFDDLVMSGRKRINKGSKNFNKFLKISPKASNFFKKINNVSFYNKLMKKIDKDQNCKWKHDFKNFKFSKVVSGAQQGDKTTNNKTDTKKNIIYLDMDFSVSEKGYNRGPHRDRDTRIMNFLIYLNNLGKKDGGILNFYNIKKKVFNYPRFPRKKDVSPIKTFNSKSGNAIFFYSTPGSYHSVSKFFGKKVKRRYFIYGSYSLNKPVNWLSKNFNAQHQ